MSAPAILSALDADRSAPCDMRSLTTAIGPSVQEVATARRRLHRKSVSILLLSASSYWVLVFATTFLVFKIGVALVLTVSLIAAATSVFHDGNHASFSTSRTVNRLAGYTGDLMGASSWIWRFKHNHLHHGNTNVDGVDADIQQSPFARLTPDQRWRPWHRLQHFYMWVLYGFLTLQWLLISDFVNLSSHGVDGHEFPRRPRHIDVANILLGKSIHIGWALVVPFLFHEWWVVVTFYLAVSWAVGFALSTMFQLAHCTALAEFPDAATPRRGADFITHQLRTTADIRCRTATGARMLHWIMGGLDFQIEHHLAPRLPHTVYPLVAARLERACVEQQLVIRSHATVWRAIWSHGHWLKLMGARPA